LALTPKLVQLLCNEATILWHAHGSASPGLLVLLGREVLHRLRHVRLALLADNMGTSTQRIAKHYRQAILETVAGELRGYVS
jgi:hypothetical protein